MVKLAKVNCPRQNHRQMHYNYVCIDKQCMEYGKELCCAYCCQELHSAHPQQILSLKQLAYSIEESLPESGELQPAKIVLNGLATCQTVEDLKKNVREILALKQQNKFSAEKINHQIEEMHKGVKTFYDRDTKLPQRSSRVNCSPHTVFLKPMLSFRPNNSFEQNSPYCITARENKLVTALAQPSLSTFKQSTEVNIKIERNSPSWIAVGVALTEQPYTETSDKHLLLFSNGWTNQRGKIVKSKIKYGRGSIIRIRWQKNLHLLQFTVKGDKVTFPLSEQWKQRVFICVCLFYAGDRVSLLS